MSVKREDTYEIWMEKYIRSIIIKQIIQPLSYHILRFGDNEVFEVSFGESRCGLRCRFKYEYHPIVPFNWNMSAHKNIIAVTASGLTNI